MEAGIQEQLTKWIEEYMSRGKHSIQPILHDDEGDWSRVPNFAHDLASVLAKRLSAVGEGAKKP